MKLQLALFAVCTCLAVNYSQAQNCADGAIIQPFSCSIDVVASIHETDQNILTGTYNCGSPTPELSGAGPEHIFLFSPLTTGTVEIQLTGLSCDLNLYVLDNTCDTLSGCLGGSTNISTDDESVSFTASFGTVYFIVVETFDPEPFFPCSYALFVASIGSGGCPEHCDNGIDDDADGGLDCEDNDCAVDTDSDGQCDDIDLDDDDDGVLDVEDTDPLNPFLCQDIDGDGCDDCSSGDNNPLNDGIDTDADGICDAGDNCPGVHNPDQSDLDGDGVGDLCDNCPDIPNPDQADADLDDLGDACDPCPVSPDPSPPDTDEDGICDPGDNCPETFNPLQSDSDNDGIGDACDPDFATEGNVGIGVDSPKSKLHISEGNFFIDMPGGGIILQSQDSTCWLLRVDNAGAVSSTPVDCPK